MTPEEKLDRVRTIQSEIETNRIRLHSAEQNVQQYLSNLEILNNSLKELLDEV